MADMRTALKSRSSSRGPVSTIRNYPAPIGGWNARDALASMKPTDAVALDNWFPSTSSVDTRGGHVEHATGTAGNIKTLATYNAVSGNATMFGYTSSGIYNVSSSGSVGASVLARTNGKHVTTMFADGTSNWLIAVNGVDKPAYYDGTTWTAVTNLTSPALTGYTGNAVENFDYVHSFKGRLFFIPKNTLEFWYLSSGVAGGSLTRFPLQGETSKGGYVVAMATWTRDAGNGVDDYAVFLTSEGEAIVYQGNNPAVATNWAKVGSYKIGKPIGKRCVLQYGADCLVITEDGLFPLSAMLATADERAKYAVSFKIESAFTEKAASYASQFGWKTVSFPIKKALIVNIPLAEDGTHEQYVMNTVTKAWCRFTGWDAEDFAVMNQQLYFCKGTKTYRAWQGTDDIGANITYYAKQAFQDFGDPKLKRSVLYMPTLIANGDITYTTGIDVDFENQALSGSTQFSAPVGSLWGTAAWGSGMWGGGLVLIRQWASPPHSPGRWLAGKLQISAKGLVAQWTACSLRYESGDGL